MNSIEASKFKNEMYNKSDNSEKSKNTTVIILPKEIMLSIFTEAGNLFQLTQISRFYNNDFDLWRNISLQERPNLFRRYPSLDEFQKQGVINWKKMGLDLVNMNRAAMHSNGENQKMPLKIQRATPLNVNVRPEWILPKEPTPPGSTSAKDDQSIIEK
jgi:hypothetical protein